MYYWLIDSGGVTLNIQGKAIADELRADSGGAVSPSVGVTQQPNDSLRVEDLIALADMDGAERDLTRKSATALGRCGFSFKRPFCDDSHKEG